VGEINDDFERQSVPKRFRPVKTIKQENARIAEDSGFVASNFAFLPLDSVSAEKLDVHQHFTEKQL
jgi:hypothetical protein